MKTAMRCRKVLIADPHPVVLHGLTNVLGTQGDFEVVASCSDGNNCIEAIRSLVPDIAVIDVSMPGLTGLEILAIANSEGLSTRLVLFTASVEDRELVISAAAGAYAVIPKHVDIETLVNSLRRVAEGQRLLAAPTVAQMRRTIRTTQKMVTDRQQQIMSLVSEGLSNKEIGRRLNVSEGTIKVHLHRIYRRLEISNRTVLAALAILHKTQ